MDQLDFANSRGRRMSAQPEVFDYSEKKDSDIIRAQCHSNVKHQFWGLSFNPFNECVISSSRLQDIVCEFSVAESSVMHVRHFGLPTPPGGKACWSRQTVVINADDTYAATDEANKQIIIFQQGEKKDNRDARILHRFGKNTMGSDDLGDFMYPCGAATDHQGKLYVTDRHRNRVQVLDIAAGKFTLLNDNLEGPKYICLNKEAKQLAVAEYDGGNVTIIDPLSGKTIRHFHKIQKNARGVQFVGTKTIMVTGDEGIQVWDLATCALKGILKKGRFAGITTTTNDKIAVADLKNNGIAIF